MNSSQSDPTQNQISKNVRCHEGHGCEHRPLISESISSQDANSHLLYVYINYIYMKYLYIYLMYYICVQVIIIQGDSTKNKNLTPVKKSLTNSLIFLTLEYIERLKSFHIVKICLFYRNLSFKNINIYMYIKYIVYVYF